MTTPCYYCEEGTSSCEVCIHGKADADEIRAAFKARTELAAERERNQRLVATWGELPNWTAIRLERDALREALREAGDKLQPIAALVDMTPTGFPDHDICPIRLGTARELRELHARIDAALNGEAMSDTFQDYLERAEKNGVIDFTLRIVRSPEGALDFYIHPNGKDGETGDFNISGTFVHKLNVGAGSSRTSFKFVGSGDGDE